MFPEPLLAQKNSHLKPSILSRNLNQTQRNTGDSIS